MNRTDKLYWIVTGIFALLMVVSAIPDILQAPDAVTLIVNHLGYPRYFVAYIGVAKVFGALALVIPGFPRVKEWAFAGFALDLVSAMYSLFAVGDPITQWLPLAIGLLLLFVAYSLHHKRLRERARA